MPDDIDSPSTRYREPSSSSHQSVPRGLPINQEEPSRQPRVIIVPAGSRVIINTARPSTTRPRELSASTKHGGILHARDSDRSISPEPPVAGEIGKSNARQASNRWSSIRATKAPNPTRDHPVRPKPNASADGGEEPRTRPRAHFSDASPKDNARA